jgi:amino acid adenylation domain-containing protein
MEIAMITPADTRNDNDLSLVKRSLLALKEMQARLDATERDRTEPIAVIGIGCRFPGGACDPGAFWRLLEAGGDAISQVPGDRWNVDALFHPEAATPGKMSSRWGGFLDRVDGFDAAFFGISPREAVRMDPQQRLLLEVAWEAFEDAGQTREHLAGSRTGVFAGICTTDYSRLQSSDLEDIDAYTGTGSSLSILAGRIAYLLDLHGPSVALDTACSSSLVAIHLACQSLRAGDCRLALAGGVNLMLSPHTTILASQMRMLAPDGRCKSFDAHADGFVRGEGCGAVVLKRLSDAIADGDPIHALIRGSAVNGDGRTNGLTAPNGRSQQAVIEQALERAHVEPWEVSYVEAHGTGTPLGDPIEMEALAAAIGEASPGRPTCAVGSVKTNVGHLEAAAGIAGFLKVVLSLEHEAIPPVLHFRTLNPNISLEGTRLAIPTELTPWQRNGKRRVAGASAFGWSGTNAHVVVEEAPAPATPTDAVAQVKLDELLVLPISAQTPDALRELAGAYGDLLSRPEAPAVRDLCYSAAVRRTHHDHRLAVVGASHAELAEGIAAFLAGEPRSNLAAGVSAASPSHRLVFVFPGQGGQWAGMAQDLLAREPVFADAIAACEAALRPHVDWSLRPLLAALPAPTSLDQIDVIQPALFAVQVALAALWRSLGIVPQAVVGHSMGEVAAAHVAGALSLDDAARIIARRSRLLRTISGRGAMAVVELPLAEAQRALAGREDRLAIAASNGPTTTVVSGDPGAVAALLDELTRREVFCRPVKVDVASHSPQVNALQPELHAALSGLSPRTAAIPFHSTVTGAPVDGRELDAAYWEHNLRQPVLFAPVIEQLVRQGHDLFVELSPHPVLGGALQQIVRGHGDAGAVLASMRRDEPGRAVVLAALGALHASGYPVDWSRLYATPGRVVSLPSYPWQRERFWHSPKASAPAATEPTDPSAHPLLGAPVVVAHAPRDRVWQAVVDLKLLPYIDDHRVQGLAVLPGAAYVEMAMAAAAQTFGAKHRVLSSFEFRRLLFFPEDSARLVQTSLVVHDEQNTTFQVHSRPADGGDAPWTLHATARIEVADTTVAPPDSTTVGGAAVIAEIQARCPTTTSAAEFYREFAERGNHWGRRFQGIAALWRGQREAIAEVHVPADLQPELARYCVHPAVLDACLQVLGATAPVETLGTAQSFVPVGIDRVVVHAPARGARLWSHAQLDAETAQSGAAFCGNVRLMDEDGTVIVELLGLRGRGLDRDAVDAAPVKLDWFHELSWPAKPLGTRPTRAEPGRWLVFADQLGVGAALAARLRSDGDEAICVGAGAGFERHGDGRYSVRADATDDVDRLVADITGLGGRAWRGAIHLWSLDAPSAPATAAVLTDAQAPTCQFVTRLVHALSALPAPPRLWLITRGAQATTSTSGPTELAQAPLWGLGRTLPLEHPALWGGLVDLDPGAGSDDSAAQLAREVVHPDGEDQIAYRSATRHVARLAPAAMAPADLGLELRADGAYLVTGGLGGLGLAVAERLVERGARQLVLMGRVGLPDRATWRAVPAETPLAQTIATVERLEARGAMVRVASLDVADEDRLATCLAALHAAGLPPIRGVVHAAGIAELVALQELDAATLDAVLRPKVGGGFALHRALAHEPLDFFVLFSSMASILSSPLLGAYSAANAFLDALAQHRRAHRQPATSIGWGYWEQIGIGARFQAATGRQGTAEGMGSFSPEAGLAAFERVVAANPVHIGVMPVDWTRWRLAHGDAARLPVLRDVCGNAASPAPATRRVPRIDVPSVLAQPAEGQTAALVAYLRRELARVLRLSEARVDVAQPLNRLGLDSLMAVELKNGIEADLGVVVPVVRFLQGPSIAQLAEQLVGLLAGRAAQAGTATLAPEPAPPTIVPAPDAGCQPFPLNDIQQAYWVGRNGFFELGSVAAHIYVEIDGADLDIDRLQDAWQKLVARHDMLRAVILPDGRQQVQAAVPAYVIEVDDLRGHAPDRVAARLDATRERLSHQVIATDRWPLFEIRASRADEHRVRIHLSLDILIADIWSWQLLFREWAALYGDLASPLAPLEITFRDYILAERALESSEAHRRSLAYWRDRIPKLPPAPELPLAANPDKLAQGRFVRRAARLEAETWQRLKARAHEAGLTPSGVLMAAFSEILATWSKTPRFTLNVTLFHRLPLHPQVNEIVGDFTSVNLLAVDAAAGDSFEDRARAVQRQLWEDLEHSRVSGVHVLRELARAHNSAPRALMPIVFTSTLGASYGNDDEGIPIDWLGEIAYSISQTPQVWIDHQVFERHGALMFNWDAVEAIFPPGLLDAMFEAYQALLVRLADAPRSWTETERRLVPVRELAVRAAANATDAAVPAGLLHTLFEDQAERRPDAVAVISDNRTLSYRELLQRSTALARELRARGARPEQLVAIVMDKGWEQVVAALAVLQAGAAYVPISPAVPGERLAFLLEHSQVRIALTQPSIDARLAWPDQVERLCVTDRDPEPGERLAPVQTADNLAYVIYTSGSTGLPKGVMIEHRAAVNTIVDMNQRFGVGPDDRILALSSLTFDLSVYDMFGALAAGGTLVLPAPSATRDPACWSELMVRTRVTIWNSVPALMQVLVDYADGDTARLPDSLRLVLMSGDWIPVGLPDRIRALVEDVQVCSLGGATEAAIWSILYPIEAVDPRWTSIPYGKPMVNQRFHVLNELLEPCPAGVAGQLFIAGVGLARGYWRDDDKTARSFVVHPRTAARLYRTGDLGRYLPDGNLEFLGREDFQVKVNGFRVELGEIEAALEQHPAVAQAVATAVGEATARRLVGHVVPRPGAAPTASQLREFLLSKLPAYLVPGSFVVVPALPLSANGKVDRAALVAPDAAPIAAPGRSSARGVAKRPMVARLERLIARVLEIDTIDPEANLFDLGVSSLEMIRIANLLQQDLGSRPPIDALYRYPTLEGLAQWYAEADLVEHHHAS